jgi:hypothetical protein
MAIKKILNDGLTNKQRILRMVERWDDDIPFEQALYHVSVMTEVMASIKEVEQEGRLRDFDEFLDELERECDEEENATANVATSRKKPQGTARSHRGRRLPKNGKVVRKSPQKSGGATS